MCLQGFPFETYPTCSIWKFFGEIIKTDYEVILKSHNGFDRRTQKCKTHDQLFINAVFNGDLW